MERRNGKGRSHRGRTAFFSHDDDEIDYFSRENLMPIRSKPSNDCIGRFEHSISKCSRLTNSGYIVCVLGLAILFLVSMMLYHFLTSHDSFVRNSGNPSENQNHLRSEQTPYTGNDDDSFSNGKSNGFPNGIVFHPLNSERQDAEFLWRNPNTALDLESRIKDNTRILNSVKLELIEIEKERTELQESIVELRDQFKALLADTKREDRRLTHIYRAIEQAKLVLRELEKAETPEIVLPPRILADPALLNQKLSPPQLAQSINCRIESCFDFSRCSISNGLRIYVSYISEIARGDIKIPSRTNKPEEACIFLSVVNRPEVDTFAGKAPKLNYWNGDGRNHLVIILDNSRNRPLKSWNHEETDLLKDLEGRYMVASSRLEFTMERRGFDFVIPPLLLNTIQDEIWTVLSPLLPVKRFYLLSHAGSYSKMGNKNVDHEMEKISAIFAGYSRTKTNDKFFFDWDCKGSTSSVRPGVWNACYEEEILEKSTFSIIIADIHAKSSCPRCQRDLIAMLLKGTIPVVVGSSLVLPFEDSIDWNRAVIRIPYPRVAELHFILRSVSENDILEMRRFGRHLLTNYLGTLSSIVKTTLSILEQRLWLPPLSIDSKDVDAAPVFPDGQLSPPESHVTEMPLLEDQEYLGPVEFPYPSPGYERNFTRLSMSKYSMWNDRVDIFSNLPFDPFQLPPLTDVQFANGSSSKYRPINNGEGGSGVEFSQQLGGNFPREQFTIVLLTYERESVLVSSLQRFNNMAYLNKVVVIWNSRKPPSPDIMWPKLSVPLVFVRPDKNSLNNRFLPLDQIETEAIFSIDDDVHLTQAEIIFAFRVWRERRDQIVGFPGRFHARDLKYDTWLYNSNHSCELSMVLTGAAFFHKYYTYLYTYHMPSAIRQKVDELMNCEDLALNFLVSHITRKPPVKVTSKWTFRCPGCPETLSADESHFVERHGCMKLFTQVYGYNPLLRTQFRADSVLFKTRLPSHCRKCFTYI